ncbi:MAG TPA: hypothetical protein VKV39_10855 [Candidatus Sulfotelmatobacter sp.]|nr:hypothetical protein [Candidatus Sulfotelmatobacter sp.]
MYHIQRDYAFAHPLTEIELAERLDRIDENAKKDSTFKVELSDRLKKKIGSVGYASLSRDQLISNIKKVTKLAGGAEAAKRQMM